MTPKQDAAVSTSGLEKIAMNIVFQIGDLLEAPVEKRQATNDGAIDFVISLIRTQVIEKIIDEIPLTIPIMLRSEIDDGVSTSDLKQSLKDKYLGSD